MWSYDSVNHSLIQVEQTFLVDDFGDAIAIARNSLWVSAHSQFQIISIKKYHVTLQARSVFDHQLARHIRQTFRPSLADADAFGDLKSPIVHPKTGHKMKRHVFA